MTKDSNAINLDLIDQLLANYKSPEDVLGENGLLKQLTKAVLERALKTELTHHLGYEKHSLEGKASGNTRNGNSKKTLKGDFGTLPIDVPRDRQSTFEPKIVPKGALYQKWHEGTRYGESIAFTIQAVVATSY